MRVPRRRRDEADSRDVRTRLAQLTPHRGVRVELPGPAGPVVALRAPAKDGADRCATAMLVPGYTGSKEDFAPLLDPLADDGFSALALDLPGQHESPGPAEEAAFRPGPLGGVVAELVRLEAAGGRRVLLLGHSYGGLVTRAAVLAGAPVAGLTLLDSGPAELPLGPRRRALDAGEPVLRRQGIVALQRLRDLAEAEDPVLAVRPPELRELLRARFLASAPAALLGMADALRDEPDRIGELLSELRRRRIGCLVVCGTGDDAWPVSLQRSMADRLDAEFAALPDAGHCPNTENPEGLLDVLLPTWRTWLAE